MNVYVAIFKRKNDRYLLNGTEIITAKNKDEILMHIAALTNNNQTLNRVFSVDEFGTKITHYDVVFDGHLKLVEKEHSY
jgi:hypothetical protein